MNKSALLLDRSIGRRLVRTGGRALIQRETKRMEFVVVMDNDDRKRAWEARMKAHRKTA